MHRYFVAVAAAAFMLCAFLAAPAQADTSGDWETLFGDAPDLLRIEVGPDAVLFHVDDIRAEGDAARELRHAMDTLPYVGDADGEVSDREWRGFEAFILQTVNAMLPSSFDLDIVTLDGKAPFRGEERPVVQVKELRIEGAPGLVTSGDAITASISVLLYFENTDQGLSVHMARFENVWGDLPGFDAEDAPPVEVRVSGYNSWTIDRDSISPAALVENLEGDTLVFTASDYEHFQSEGSGVAFQVRGDPSDRVLSDAEESPAPALLAVLILGLAALVMARRRD